MQTQQRRPAIDWNSIDLLSEVQREGVLQLEDACSELPLPSNLVPELKHSSNSSSDLNLLGKASRAGTNGSSALQEPIVFTRTRNGSVANIDVVQASLQASKPRSGLHVEGDQEDEGPIETTQQFFDWFAEMEREMERDQEDVYRNYLSVVVLYREACSGFLGQIAQTSVCFKSLEEHYAFVEEKTKALQLACEELLLEQTTLQALADLMASKLSYFHQLDAVTRLFNAPGDEVCLRSEFVPMLKKLDECLDYVAENIKYKDSELCQMQFRQCMTRGMTLIKMHLVTRLRALSNEITTKKPVLAKGESMSYKDSTALFYTRFLIIAPPLQALVQELENRCEGHKEYNSLLNDCYNCYFSVRQQHLAPLITSKIKEMGPSQKDKLQFARHGLSYMNSICKDEYALFYDFFSSGENEVYGYLDTLIGYLYDYLRPRIIHENKIDILSDLCMILNSQPAEIPMGQDSTLAFGYLIRNMLQDTQQRLVYRAQAFVRSEIQGFKPKPEDLNYPARLQLPPALPNIPSNGTHSKSSSMHQIQNHPDAASISQSASEVSSPTPSLASSTTGGYFASPTFQQFVENAEIYYGWYPPLQTSLWLLNKVHKCVNQSIFDDLSQETLSICLVALNQASTMIKEKQEPIDGTLFLIKHLLILKEKIKPFNGNFVHTTKEVDFSRMTDAITALFRDRSKLLNFGSWFGAVSQTMTPTLVDSVLNAGDEIDRDLKLVCETFILDMGKAAVESLAGFMNKVAGFRIRADVVAQQQQQAGTGSSRRPPMLLKDQPFARPEELKRIMTDFRETVPPRIQWTVRKLSNYLSDPKTEAVLMRPIQNFIFESYKSFYTTILEEYDPAMVHLVASGGHIGLKDLDPLDDTASWIMALVLTEQEKWHHSKANNDSNMNINDNNDSNRGSSNQ